MAVESDFDRFFMTMPVSDAEKDFGDFWTASINELRQIPIEPSLTPRGKEGGFIVHDVTFKGLNRTTVTGELMVPRGARRPRVVICLHDYNRENPYRTFPLDADLAYYFLKMRGHHMLVQKPGEEHTSPGYMTENITDMKAYYLRGIYLDAYRAVDMLRLNGDLDCSRIGIMGKGLGAAAAAFAVSYSDRISAIVLDTPSFIYLTESQNTSTGDATAEINAWLTANKSRKKQVKKTLSYFDALNFSGRITCPALFTVGFKDHISPPRCVFALFNRLTCDKTIEVYPEGGNDAGSEVQFRKSIAWLKKIILSD
jgi:cephalosporin-C deacetylase